MSFALRAGEILGVAALEGQGQDLLFDYLAGERKPQGGDARRRQPHTPGHPYDAIRSGVVLVPADRMLALLPQRPIRENIATPLYNRLPRWGPINRGDENRRVSNAIDRLSIDTRAQRQARRLSGGNQQKLTIARWLAAGFTTMLCFDPTRGIDVGTKRQIYALLRELAEAGAAVLLFTTEFPEIQLVCDRTIVVYRGAVTAEMPASDADEPALLKAAHGLTRRRRRHDHRRRRDRPQGHRLATGHQPPRLDDRRLRPVLLLVIAYIWALAPVKFTSFDLKTIVIGALPLAFAAMAQAVIVISGGIDLSLGVMVAVINVLAASLMEDQSFATSLLIAVGLMSSASCSAPSTAACA